MSAVPPFKAPPWLRDPHAQTIWASRCRRAPRLAPTWERFALPDGDFVDLAAIGPDNGPLIVIFHGLEGGVYSRYARGIMQACRERAWGSMVMHFRGCSGVDNRLPRGYHSGDTGDIRTLLTTLAERFPRRPLAAIGYSLGGNALLKYLGEEASQTPLSTACAVSVPFDLDNAARRLSRGLSRLYQWHLVGNMRRRMARKLERMSSPLALTEVRRYSTFRGFDNAVTAPLHGFRDVDHYYGESSCGQYLETIAIPTLILHARDDPFMTPEAIPRPGQLSDAIRLEVSATGGHVGFVDGTLRRPHYWLETRIPVWFAEHIQSH